MKNLSTFVRASLIIVGLLTLSSCGQKGPLILEEVPVEKTQQPLQNSLDEIPVEEESALDEEASENPDAAE